MDKIRKEDGVQYSRIEEIREIVNNYDEYGEYVDNIYWQELQPKILSNTKYFIHVRADSGIAPYQDM